ncbi:MAG: catalase, partial [Lachnospiraceae bacterium]|nr:catalase [Lachnospiraceae bacterium]
MVRRHCFKVGLYWQGLIHDLSKYSYTEFSAGVKYYQGVRSPNVAERNINGYSKAWIHHKGRNKHHYEYWTDYSIETG